ncbi:MAG: putative transport-related rane protein [Bacteroidetes bacterium]|nr:putative transport-related rane protein [Bacteroidota bacterium]
MRKLLIDIYYVWREEIKVVFRDPAVILFFLVVPVFYPLVYTSFYNNEVMRDVKVVVVDDSRSSLSREFVRKVDATPDVKIVGYATDMQDAQKAMWRGDAYSILYIPSEFSKNLHTFKQTKVQAYSEIRSMLLYKALPLAVTDVSLDMGANIRVEDVGHGSQKQDESSMQAVVSEWVPFYNTTNGFASFLIPAVLILIIQQTLILGIGTLVGTHNDRKTFTIASHAHIGKSINSVRLTLGKGLAYSLVYIVVSVWVLRVAPYLFHLPQIGEPMTIAVFLMPFLLASTFFAMTLSYFVSQREFAFLLLTFTSILFIFLSGISWPWTSMPPALKAIAALIPSTPAIHGFVKINTMGASFEEVWPEYLQLWVQAVVYFILAVFMYKWWIRNYDPQYEGKLPEKE